jgi:uncharacterized membrane protein
LLILGVDIPGLVAVTPASAAAAKSAHAMTELGTGEATSINDVGQIVGNSQRAVVISWRNQDHAARPEQLHGRRLQQRNRDQQPQDRRGLRHRQRL